MDVIQTQAEGRLGQRIEVDAWAMVGSLLADQKIVWVGYDEDYARAVLARAKEIASQ